MSWNLKASGSNREEAIRALDSMLEIARDNCPIAGQIQTAAGVLMENMPPESVKQIETFGHINADGTGYAMVKINT
jgi:hypothetical protein